MPFRLSIITATRNRADYLPRCIESVARQSYADKEHIIIDGASTDDTVGILLDYGARYPHLRWVSEPDSGISEAFNKGLAMMTGDAFGIIGDDDVYESDVFDAVVDAFDAFPDVGVVAGNCAIMRNDDTIAAVQRASFTSRADLIACWNHWGTDVVLPAPSTFVRRAAVERVGGFDTADRYAMDYDHWIRITEHFGVATIDRTLARFRHDEGALSYSHVQRQFDESVAISRRYWGRPGSPSYLRLLASYRWFQLRRALARNRVVRRLRGQDR